MWETWIQSLGWEESLEKGMATLTGIPIPANEETYETQVRSLGREDPLEVGMATHSSVLAWRVSWSVVLGVAESQTQLSNFHFQIKKSGGLLRTNCQFEEAS